MKSAHLLSLAAALAVSTAFVPQAQAQQRVDTVEYTGPDRGLLKGGIWTLGLSYAPALVVGIASPLPEDRYLLAPVACPWLDFAKRDCTSCAHEGWNKALLVTDGLIQGVGALEILGSFMFVEHSTSTRTVSYSKKHKPLALHIVPRFMGSYGLTAIGKF
ncbi:MAG TPA: hypothetical protein VFV94_04220 [Polyangiaceae bacterium]|nr:hypothetical protein [Polyangiaceae bacterium]